MVCWNASVIQILDALVWLNLHKHGWEYAELLHENIMEEVKELTFRLFGKKAGHAHKLAGTIMEEDTCELLCLDSLFISDSTNCFSLAIEEISCPLAPHIVDAEQKM